MKSKPTMTTGWLQPERIETYAEELDRFAADLVATGEREHRALSAAEQKSFDETIDELRTVIPRRLSEARASETNSGRLAELRGVRGDGSRRTIETRSRGRHVETLSATDDDGRRWLPSTREYRQAEQEQLFETRAQTEGDPAKGGVWVPSPISERVFERVQEASVFIAAGPQEVRMDSMTLGLSRLDASSVVAKFLAEREDIPLSDVGSQRVMLTARKLAAATVASNELLEDATPDGRRLLARGLEIKMSEVLDKGALVGTGDPASPIGLTNWPGIHSTPSAGGLDLSEILTAITTLNSRGAVANALFVSPSDWASVQLLKNVGGDFLLSPDVTAGARRALFGVPVYPTGALTGSGKALVADMAFVVYGYRVGLSLFYDPYSQSLKDSTIIRARWRCDVVALDVAALELITIAATLGREPTPDRSGPIIGSGGAATSGAEPKRR